MKRRQSRETAFLLLFAWSFQELEAEELIAQAEETGQAEMDAFARELVTKTIGGCAELDKLIERYSEKWKLNRLSRVTLTVLRMSFCELTLFSSIPAGATINEAVELVKRFAAEDEAAFVNGILGTFQRERTGQKSEEAR